jgi:hypothetical protein
LLPFEAHVAERTHRRAGRAHPDTRHLTSETRPSDDSAT